MENDKNLQPETLSDEDLNAVSGGNITYDFPDPKFQIGQLVMLNTGKSLDCYGVHCDASTIGRVKAVHTVSYIKGFVYEIECLRCGGQMYAQDKQVSTKLPDGAGIVLEEYLVAIS